CGWNATGRTWSAAPSTTTRSPGTQPPSRCWITASTTTCAPGSTWIRDRGRCSPRCCRSSPHVPSPSHGCRGEAGRTPTCSPETSPSGPHSTTTNSPCWRSRSKGATAMSEPTMELEVCRCCYLAAAGYSDHETGEDHESCRHDEDEPLSHWTNAPAITT